MKIAHWTLKNGSGMHRVAEDMSIAEKASGRDSIVLASNDSSEWAGGMDADIHVIHCHLPDSVRKRGGKVVWIGHGTPEHCFQLSVEAGINKGYGASDSWMLAEYWIKNADALVTFWPRHQWIWQSLCDKGRKVQCFPLGVDKTFWKPTPSRGKYAGEPSLFTAENCHYIKWPLDLALLWPSLSGEMDEARLHIGYLPYDQHRWWFPLLNRNGASFKSFISANVLGREDLRNAFNSTDYYIGLVRYGDYNKMTLEAKASGSKVISYAGNPYADYWVTEGDQQKMAKELLAILKSEIAPRDYIDVPDIKQTTESMIEIYNTLAQ